MKITQEHYAYIKDSMNEILNRDPEMYVLYQDEGLSPMRFRWDLANTARLTTWVSNNIYPYANDNHLDTAYRQVMKEAGVAWASN